MIGDMTSASDEPRVEGAVAQEGQLLEAGESRRPSPLARVLLALLAVYRWTAPLRRSRCRFYPSCSTYAVESIQVHGAVRGSGQAIRRVSRCHPWNPGGFDPVKPKQS